MTSGERTEKLSITLTDDQWHRLVMAARFAGVTLDELISDIVDDSPDLREEEGGLRC